MIAVLFDSEADFFGPWSNECFGFRDDDARTADTHFAVIWFTFIKSPAFTTFVFLSLGVAVENVTVITEHDDGAPSGLCFVQKNRQHFDLVPRPTRVDLFSLQQVVVNCVHHHTNDLAMSRADFLADVRGQAGVLGFLERSLVKQHGREASAALGQQTWMFGEPGSFRVLISLLQLATKQACARHFGHAWHSRHPWTEADTFFCQQHPVMPKDVIHQLTEHSNAHPVQHDHEHGSLRSQRRDDAIQNLFNRRDHLVSRLGGRPVSQQAGKYLRPLLARTGNPIEQFGVGFR